GPAFGAGGSRVRDRFVPSSGQISATAHAADGRAGILRAVPEGPRLRWRDLHGVRAHYARARARRLGSAFAGFSAGRAHYTGDPFLRVAGATRALVAGTRIRRAGRLFCAHGTWTRLGSGRDGNARRTRR